MGVGAGLPRGGEAPPKDERGLRGEEVVRKDEACNAERERHGILETWLETAQANAAATARIQAAVRGNSAREFLLRV